MADGWAAGRIALVTGATSGFGEAMARRLIAAGAKVIATGRRVDRLQGLADELGTTDLLTRELDVRSAASIDALLPSLPPEFQAIDVLYNNAGLALGLGKAHEALLSDWETMIETNVTGLVRVTRAVLPGMVARRHGHVINLGSVAGHEVYPGGAVYCATKHAVDAITRGLRMDVLGTGVRVSTVDPGMVETEFSVVRFRGDRERADRVYRDMTPLTPDDIADTVLWVATRPPHVNVDEVIIKPTDQASATQVHRQK